MYKRFEEQSSNSVPKVQNCIRGKRRQILKLFLNSHGEVCLHIFVVVFLSLFFHGSHKHTIILSHYGLYCSASDDLLIASQVFAENVASKNTTMMYYIKTLVVLKTSDTT
jgi:hypothetical protein